jgi:hypothetical protein
VYSADDDDDDDDDDDADDDDADTDTDDDNDNDNDGVVVFAWRRGWPLFRWRVCKPRQRLPPDRRTC